MKYALFIGLFALVALTAYAAPARADVPPPALPPGPPAAGTTFAAPPCPPTPPGALAPGERRLHLRRYGARGDEGLPGEPRPFPTMCALSAVPVVMFLAIAAVIIVAILVAHRSRALRYEALTAALKEGKEIPPALLANGHGRHDPLGGGLVLVALGLGLGIALGVVAGPAQAVWGLIPLLIGLALLAAIPLRRRMKDRE